MEPTIIRIPKRDYIFVIITTLFGVAVLIYMLFDKETAPIDRVKSAALLPFLCLVLYVVFRLAFKNQPYLKLSDAGIELQSSGYSLLLAWSAIDNISHFQKGHVKYTTIRLSSYYSLFSQIERADVKKIIKQTNLSRATGYAIVIPALLAAEPDQMVEFAIKIYEKKDVPDFFSLLHHNRVKYGGDFLIGRTSKNRDVKKFAAYLIKMKEIYSRDDKTPDSDMITQGPDNRA
jgi:hypothetical protein